MLSRHAARSLRTAAVVLGVLLALTLLGGAYLYNLSLTLPDLSTAPEALKAAKTTIVYAADGSVLAEWHGDEDRRVVRLSSVPRHARDAVIAAEDERFFEHDGVDVDAMLGNLSPLGGRAKGSTITQQLVRLLFSGRERGITQKLREALMAYEIEGRTPKDKVLEAYLNMVYLGEGCYGLESASERYFGRPASGLTLGEAALLAGMIDAPGRYSPAVDIEAARIRRDDVLARMRDLALITSEQELEARTETVRVQRPEVSSTAPYFVEMVKQELIRRLGTERVFTGGLRVQTTLDPVLQAHAEDAIKSVLRGKKDPEAALVSIDPQTGYIVALVGGRDFGTNQFNLAAQGKRQPGSAFKPFVLVAALEKGISPSQRFDTSPLTIKVKDGNWRVENYEGAYGRGSMTLSEATNRSVNAVFARLVMRVGAERVVEVARRMGIRSPLEPNPAIALGGLSRGVSPLEMAAAYGTLATGGKQIDPTAVVRVTDDAGKVVYAPTDKLKRALTRTVASRTSAMLHDVVQRGTGKNARFGKWAAGKTGTSQSYRDAWFVGYTGNLSTSVWVGYRERLRDMLHVHGIKVAGGTYPATIWGRYMYKAAQAVTPSLPAGASESTGAVAPGGLVRVRICSDSFKLANKRCPRVTVVDLERKLVPKAVCDRH